ncbi:hypothetical protein KUCAC02_010089 [Chaenocephalus aceratus]|uniref:Uncharacterized protein n=1 Tax=Chaenocephalus aceratus TaxID=36190 RepID=A0ACB9VYX9_CHAAC|nr:hypothetical protein KUCAC02_010089 [Chaenocephalus aceratus]
MSRGVWFPALGLLAWLCCLSLGPVEGGKVLVVPVDGSLSLSMKILVKELSERGHEILALVPETSLLIHGSESFKTEVYPVPFTKAELDGKFNELKDGVFLKPPKVTDLFINLQRLVNFTTVQVTACESLLNNQPLMGRLREGGFDVLLTDPFLPCGSVLAHIFNIPTVYFLRGLPCEMDLKANQVPSPRSYIHVAFSGDDMTYSKLLSNGAIWLLRYDFTFEWPRPLLPNMVFIGGINCGKKSPLPADLQEFVDGSGDDGFMVSNMPTEKAKQFVDAFRQIPQRNDLRAHPKVRAFMTHGGSNGIYEGICHAVPMLMFPLFGDQGDNVHRMVARGVAVKLGIYDVTTESLLAGLNTIIHDKSYKENIVRLSEIHLDRPVPPLDLAVFWTEFVIRHKGAEHLRLSLTGASESGIVGGNVAKPHSRPYMASLQFQGKHSCGGVLIREDFVLTAAHCEDYKENIVRLSEIHLDRPVPPLDLAVFWIEFGIRHKGAEHLWVAAHDLNWIQRRTPKKKKE